MSFITKCRLLTGKPHWIPQPYWNAWIFLSLMWLVKLMESSIHFLHPCQQLLCSSQSTYRQAISLFAACFTLQHSTPISWTQYTLVSVSVWFWILHETYKTFVTEGYFKGHGDTCGWNVHFNHTICLSSIHSALNSKVNLSQQNF